MKLYDFHADWCGPCQVMHPRVDEFAKNHPDIEVVKVNVEQSPELCSKYQVKNIPTFVVVDENDAVLARKSGAIPVSELDALCQN